MASILSIITIIFGAVITITGFYSSYIKHKINENWFERVLIGTIGIIILITGLQTTNIDNKTINIILIIIATLLSFISLKGYMENLELRRYS